VTAIDISAVGIRFQGEELFEVSEPLELQIDLPNAREPLLLQGQVVRNQPLSSGMTDYAVEFVDVTLIQQAAIDTLVSFLRKHA
jgi:hypothetical protein